MLTGIGLLGGGAGLLSGKKGAMGRVAGTVATIAVLVAGISVGHSGGELVYKHGAANTYFDGLGVTNSALSARRFNDDED